MIEKSENKSIRHKWEIADEFPIATIFVNDGELFIDVHHESPEIEQAKEFHQALGEAIAIAEAQE